jgi:DNA-binding MarR family transcriptional regulator
LSCHVSVLIVSRAGGTDYAIVCGRNLQRPTRSIGVQLHYNDAMKQPHELCYCHAARGSARFLSRLYDRHLVSVGINIQQLTILSIIFHDPGILVADLADRMIMERTTLLRALKPLQSTHLLKTETPGIGRSLAFSVSQAGQEKLIEASPLWRNAQHEIETLLGKRKAKSLRKAMQDASALN